jgi:hypothetical protein
VSDYEPYARSLEGKALLMTMDAILADEKNPDFTEVKRMLADSLPNELLDLAAAASWLRDICQELYDERQATA